MFLCEIVSLITNSVSVPLLLYSAQRIKTEASCVASSIVFASMHTLWTQTHTHTNSTVVRIHMASVSGKSITSKVQTWQPKGAPRGVGTGPGKPFIIDLMLP